MLEYNLIIRNVNDSTDSLSLPVIVYDYDSTKKNYETYPQKINKKYRLSINHTRYSLNTNMSITGSAYNEGILYSNDYDPGEWNNGGNNSGGNNYGGSPGNNNSGNEGGGTTTNGISIDKNPLIIDKNTSTAQVIVTVEGATNSEEGEIIFEIEDTSIIYEVRTSRQPTIPQKTTLILYSRGNIGNTNIIISSKKDNTKSATLLVKVVEDTSNVPEEPTTPTESIKLNNSNYILMDYTGGDYDFKLTANTDWKVKEYPNWVTLPDGDSGTSNTTSIKLSFDEYPGTNGMRMGYIIFEAKNNPSVTAKCMLVQEVNETDDTTITVIEGPENGQAVFHDTGAMLKLFINSSISWYIDYDDYAISLDTFIGGAGTTEVNGLIYRDTTTLLDCSFIRVNSLKNYLRRYTYELEFYNAYNLYKIMFPSTSSNPTLRNDDSVFNVLVASYVDWKLENIPYWINISPTSGGPGVNILTISTSNITGILDAEIKCISNEEEYPANEHILHLTTSGVFKANEAKYGFFNYTYMIFSEEIDIRTLKVFSNASWVILTDALGTDIQRNKEYVASLGWDNIGSGNKEIEINIGNLKGSYHIILYERIDNGNTYEVGNKLGSAYVVSLKNFGDAYNPHFMGRFYEDYNKYPSLYRGEPADRDDGRDVYKSISEYLTLDKYYIFVPREENTIQLNIYTDKFHWNADAPSWCSLSKTSGTGNDTITITVSENTSLDERYDAVKVYIMSDGMGINSAKSFHITQDSYITIDGLTPTLTLTPDTRTIGPYEFGTAFNVNTNLRRWSYKVEHDLGFSMHTTLDGKNRSTFVENIKGSKNIIVSFESTNEISTSNRVATFKVIPPEESGLSIQSATFIQEGNIYNYYVDLSLTNPDLSEFTFSDTRFFYSSGGVTNITMTAKVMKKNTQTNEVTEINGFTGPGVVLRCNKFISSSDQNDITTKQVIINPDNISDGQPAVFNIEGFSYSILIGNSSWKMSQVNSNGVTDIQANPITIGGTITDKIVGILDNISYPNLEFFPSGAGDEVYAQLTDISYKASKVQLPNSEYSNVLGIDDVLTGDRKHILPNSSTPTTWTYNIATGEENGGFIIFSKNYYNDSTLVIDTIKYGHPNEIENAETIYDKNTNNTTMYIEDGLDFMQTKYYILFYRMKTYVWKTPQIFNGTLYITSHFE